MRDPLAVHLDRQPDHPIWQRFRQQQTFSP